MDSSLCSALRASGYFSLIVAELIYPIRCAEADATTNNKQIAAKKSILMRLFLKQENG
jgi:hypothetical protein